MESKPNFAKVHGPWWTQIKVVLIQKGLLDNQNPGICMGWPGLYLLMDNIDQLGSLCIGPFVPICSGAPELYACARQLELAPLFHFNMLIFLCNGTTKQTYTFIVVNYTKQQKSIVFYGFCRIILAVLFKQSQNGIN